jgi:hypothetical protein
MSFFLKTQLSDSQLTTAEILKISNAHACSKLSRMAGFSEFLPSVLICHCHTPLPKILPSQLYPSAPVNMCTRLVVEYQ